MTEQEVNHQTPQEGIIWSSIRSLPFLRQVKGLHLAGKSVILTPAGLTAGRRRSRPADKSAQDFTKEEFVLKAKLYKGKSILVPPSKSSN